LKIRPLQPAPLVLLVGIAYCKKFRSTAADNFIDAASERDGADEALSDCGWLRFKRSKRAPSMSRRCFGYGAAGMAP
jgi:hypothetical protein